MRYRNLIKVKRLDLASNIIDTLGSCFGVIESDFTDENGAYWMYNFKFRLLKSNNDDWFIIKFLSGDVGYDNAIELIRRDYMYSIMKGEVVFYE